MANLMYSADKECREATTIQFELPDNLTIDEFKTVCIRMASAMGYDHIAIWKEFIQKKNIINTVYVDWPEMQSYLSGSLNNI